jgi:uncharacterized membrane protein YgcG
MPKIVVSYRRADSAAIAGRIFDRLTTQYGDDSVFMDVDNIPFGTDFRHHIRQVLETSDIFIAVVGPHWGGAEGASRIREEADPVRVEVETALARGMPVIPLLVDGARMPTVAELPESLQAFAYLNAAPVDIGRDFRLHMDRVIRSVDSIAAGTPNTLVSRPPQVSATQNAAAATGSKRSWMLWPALLAVVAAAGAGVWMFNPMGLLRPASPPVAMPAGAAFPAYKGRVNDETGMLHASTLSALTQRLADLEAKTNVQVVAALLREMPSSNLSQFGEELARRWNVGGEQRRGVLLLIFPSQRRLVMHVGTGAREKLNPAADSITQNADRLLQSDDVIGSLMRAVDDISNALNGTGVARAPANPAPVAPAAPPPTTYRIIPGVSGGVQNMRSGPATKYPIVVAIPAGSTGIALGACRKSDDGTRPWCAANWRTYAGWISSCCIVDERTGAPPRID